MARVTEGGRAQGGSFFSPLPCEGPSGGGAGTWPASPLRLAPVALAAALEHPPPPGEPPQLAARPALGGLLRTPVVSAISGPCVAPLPPGAELPPARVPHRRRSVQRPAAGAALAPSRAPNSWPAQNNRFVTISVAASLKTLGSHRCVPSAVAPSSPKSSPRLCLRPSMAAGPARRRLLLSCPVKSSPGPR